MQNKKGRPRERDMTRKEAERDRQTCMSVSALPSTRDAWGSLEQDRIWSVSV